MNSNEKAFAYVVFFAASAAILQIAIATAIVAIWGWLALFAYAFIGSFVNAYAMQHWKYKLVP
jgi:hypothetical protein